MTAERTVLIVDDDREVAAAQADLVVSLGYRVFIETDSQSVEDRLRNLPSVDLVLLDIRMPGLDGLELLQQIKLRWPGIGAVMATVVNDIDHAVRAIKCGAYNYLLKPIQPDRVRSVLDSYFQNRPKLLTEDPRFSSFITQAPAFLEIFRRAESFARADVPVLIRGETGTGKELMAQLLHALSSRRAGPMLTVNMAALSATLFESELFGYARGAFTGAARDHAGYFESVGRGTLFLDEIGELSPEHQKKLLRVLQAGKFSRVGETEERTFQGRLVFATNRDIEKDADRDAYRRDLFYRLSAHTLILPPLRERPGDVDLLARYFLNKYTSQFGRTIEGFSPEVLEILRRYDYPGNVRELEGIVSSAVLIEQTALIQPGSLPQSVVRETGGVPLDTAREREIRRVLEECGGNQTKAAERLGIARGTLNRFLHGKIPPPPRSPEPRKRA